MSQKSKKKVPELRFSEFNGDWEPKYLDQIGDFKNGFNADKQAFGTGTEFINLMDIFGKSEIRKTYLGRVEIHQNQLEQYKIQKGDILLVRSSVKREGVGQSCLVNDDFEDTVYSGFIIRFREKFNTLYHLYKKYCFSEPSFRKEILAFATSSANTNINQDSLSQILLFYPSIAEQEKIASFLGAVDIRLTQLRRKRDRLQTYKRGVMQKIFSQVVRFKSAIGSGFPDWEEEKLGEVLDWVKTNSLSRENLNYDSGIVQNIHYGDIHGKFKSQFRLKDEEVPYITDLEFVSNLDDESFCKVGDLVIADASEDYADIGKTIEIIEVEPKKLVAGLHCFIARPKENLLTVGFSGYLFQTENVRNQIRKIAQGISVLGISKFNLGNILLPYPRPLEQEKIANFLTAIDRKIEAISRQLDRTEQFKKGLLQKMFV